MMPRLTSEALRKRRMRMDTLHPTAIDCPWSDTTCEGNGTPSAPQAATASSHMRTSVYRIARTPWACVLDAMELARPAAIHQATAAPGNRTPQTQVAALRAATCSRLPCRTEAQLLRHSHKMGRNDQNV